MTRKRTGVRAGLEMFDVRVGGESFVVLSVGSADDAALAYDLTEAERRVASDAGSGLSNSAIAQKRGRAVRTIANQLASIYRKVGVSSRAELTARLLAG